MPPPLRGVRRPTSRCDAFDDLLRQAGIAQEHTVFAGAAVCAVVAAVLALVLFRGAPHRGRYPPVRGDPRTSTT